MDPRRDNRWRLEPDPRTPPNRSSDPQGQSSNAEIWQSAETEPSTLVASSYPPRHLDTPNVEQPSSMDIAQTPRSMNVELTPFPGPGGPSPTQPEPPE